MDVFVSSAFACERPKLVQFSLAFLPFLRSTRRGKITLTSACAFSLLDVGLLTPPKNSSELAAASRAFRVLVLVRVERRVPLRGVEGGDFPLFFDAFPELPPNQDLKDAKAFSKKLDILDAFVWVHTRLAFHTIKCDRLS